MRITILILLLPVAFLAQAQEPRFSFGIKAGIPATAALPYSDFSGPTFSTIVDTGRWTVGPTAELRLAGDFSLEADVLYRGYRYQETSGFQGSFIPAGPGMTIATVAVLSIYRQDAREWDVPVLLKYRFKAGSARPFVDAGFTFAHVSSDFTGSFSCIDAPDACKAAGLSTTLQGATTYKSGVNRRGPAAGVGVEFKYRRIRIAPEVRYMHLTRPNVNEVTVMAGFTF